MEFKNLGFLSGILTPIWLIVGVTVAGALYPGYSHFNQALSELGAIGAPTHLISPMINNYPLGVLFALFGTSIIKEFPYSKLARFTGVLIVIHGVGSITAGYFSCDVGCNPQSPSESQIIHNLSGLVMFLSLVIASGVWVHLGPKLVESKALGIFSLLCTLLAIVVLLPMILAIESGLGFGLYQRLNYGASVVWVSGLAYVLFKRNSSRS
ncbi:DUF998 domain-containing protein [Zhongshania sp. BJYM1]|uniref:DUF998 domain-containing protein n=1 Tax=Zhongshania aquatica TaxID=2965069 RepID=UPI0022B35125|nr:DUF998 domain-containing protein [Marortus sp. BJYM1]